MPLDAAVGDQRHAVSRRRRRHSTSACSCGTPKLVVMRVVQPPPGPMPTLTALTPRSTRNRTPSAVATLPATSSTSGKCFLNASIALRHHHRMAVRDVDDDHIDLRLHELRGALEIIAGGANRGADAQPAMRVARGKGQPLLPRDVLGGDQADQRAVLVDQRQLLDLALDHQPLGDVERQLAFARDQRLDRRHPRGHRAFARVRRTARRVR